MNKQFEQMGFLVEHTKDGSPTLKLSNLGEPMHHSGGAASETLYIYKSVIDFSLKVLETTQTCVVGLGLGYIEISWALSLIEHNLKAGAEHSLTTFESVSELKNHFTQWLFAKKQESPFIYDEIIRSLNANFNESLLKYNLVENYKNHNMKSDFLKFDGTEKWNIICYDAFSSKTNQQFWSESFLNSFFKKHTHEDCIFTTYACTGTLKKALADNDFKVIKRPAFQGKGGHCTLGVRGKFKDYDFKTFRIF